MSNCNTNQPFNVRIIPPCNCSGDGEGEGEENDQGEIEVRGIAPIKVVKRKEGLKTVFIVSYSPSVSPTCSVSVSPSSVEIGIPGTFVFTYVDQEGSSPIVTRTKTPNDSPLTTTFMSGGAQGTHSYSVTDEEGQSSSCSASINVLYRFFKGTIARNVNSLDVTTIEAMTSALGSSIGGAFGRQEYTMDKTQGHFIWVYPVDFGSIPTPTGDANLPFGLEDVPGTWTINGITYKAAKTGTYFTQGGTATLGF